MYKRPQNIFHLRINLLNQELTTMLSTQLLWCFTMVLFVSALLIKTASVIAVPVEDLSSSKAFDETNRMLFPYRPSSPRTSSIHVPLAHPDGIGSRITDKFLCARSLFDLGVLIDVLPARTMSP
ncbi:hypothetical protein BV22DRAFT_149582 [Leucogyrophana mollusca]|uniref:Uncharacterized protein n=1 Tax=Leucogyrophana mollusca TaxID=85980 RepID=A0ACB8BUG7_9AGAM|nr:hypothetical protein BV22DRAFT_149582 [Leucogyrophana mollusca]